MNTQQKALRELEAFVHSKETCVLITGTHQYQKHRLALKVLGENLVDAQILFRVNAINNLDSILGSNFSKHKPGESYKLGPNRLYIDSVNPRSWGKTPSVIDAAVLYPLDSVNRDKNKQEIIRDLLHLRKVKKLFLASWTDTHDFSWVNEYIDRHVIYDAEEEDPEYHQRVLNLIQGKF